MATVKCPECGERVKVREDGKPSRCAECGTTFRVKTQDEDKDESEEEEERSFPRRKPAAKKKSSGAKLAAIIVGGLLAVGLVAAVIVLVVRKGKDGETQPVDQSKVTAENFKNVKPGMDLAEVESILGGSKSSSEDDMRDAYRKAFGEVEAAWETGWARFGEGTTWRRWEGKNFRAWVAFAKTKDGSSRAAFSTSLEQINGGHRRVDGFATFAGNHDLDKMNEDRKRESAVRDDKKWVRGADARALVVGEWRDAQADGYLFAADGKATNFSAILMPETPPGSYRVIDDRYLEYTAPPLFNPPPGHPQQFPAPKTVPARYEYLVNRDELALIDASPQPIFGLRTYCRMPATAGSVAEAKLVTPMLEDAKSGDATKRQVALYRLRQLGKGAPTAAPALRELAKQTRDARLRGEIESVIRAIEGK